MAINSPKWTYGNSWERFPIETGEIWEAGTGLVTVHNIFDPLPGFMFSCDTLFIDPPWNLGNLNSFYTKAGRTDHVKDFEKFYRRLFLCITEIRPKTVYIEIGNQNVDVFKGILMGMYLFIERWNVAYYKKHPCFILRGGMQQYNGKDLTGMDEADCIREIAAHEEYSVIGDLCMGRGLVGYHAFNAGRSFRGTELNKRRLAVLLDNIAKAGGEVHRIE